jgi:hypothetical protein
MTASCLSLRRPTGLVIAATALGCSPSNLTSPSDPAARPPTPPAVISVVPRTGSTAGGTLVTITGTGFVDAATVTLNGQQARVESVASTSIVAVTPAAAQAEAVEVLVRNPDGGSGRLPGGFIYVLAGERPTITSVSADPGSTGGGVPFTIAGAGFLPGVTVRFDGAQALALLIEGKLKGTTPPHAAGSVDVTVTNPDGQSDTLAGSYTYLDPGSLDFNGEWQGYGTEGEVSLTFTVRDNGLVAVSCPPLQIAVSPPVPVITGTVVFNGSDGIFTGRIVTATLASGTLSLARCFAGTAHWEAVKR